MTKSFNVQSFFDTRTSTFTHLIDDGIECAVIDPVLGFDLSSGIVDTVSIDVVEQVIIRRGLTLRWLLETHIHADHLSGSALLKRRLGGLVGIGRRVTDIQTIFREVFNARDVATDGSAFDRLWNDDERFQVGKLHVRAMYTPGHTSADIAYAVGERLDGPLLAVFVGDSLLMPDVGTARCDFHGGDAELLYDSIRRLMQFERSTPLYMCHDYPPPGRVPGCVTTVGEQRDRNIHVRDGIGKSEFVALRSHRDAGLTTPVLMQPAVQVNIRAGNFPPAEESGVTYIKIPLRNSPE
ncbi:MBL fold metallo-hydrolase [Diaphorobacter caeni]|uniref:MBL fold metallo-hydrolase n=1 Tax=Diaphorobacter caeni TaxID=2784387 RepID=UPI001890B51D|nr:MBL fold metallo-hydrolase [Diaphorobacter caeni]MBF5007234.1 MBL fold metallo-hydrolase [Diaphorobacter caeni]